MAPLRPRTLSHSGHAWGPAERSAYLYGQDGVQSRVKSHADAAEVSEMRITESLEKDHRIIEIMLPALERLGEQARRSRPVDKDVAEIAVSFLRTFVDAYHHGKEEFQLFVGMERRGVRRDTGLVHHLLEEHGRGRSHVREMYASLARLPAGAADGDPQAAAAFAEHAISYVKLLRHHIREEDAELWPLASRVLSEDDDSRLMEACAQVERTALGEGGRDQYRGQAEEIARLVSA